MADERKPLLNRGSLGALPVLDEAAVDRILSEMAVPLLPRFPRAEFSRFLNDAAQFGLDASFSAKPTSREIIAYKKTYQRLIELSHDFQHKGVPVPMPPDKWRDQADRFVDEWENADPARQGQALNDLHFAGSLIGLFCAATGLEPTVTTNENAGGNAGPLARFVIATVREMRDFCQNRMLDTKRVKKEKVQRFVALPDSSALRKQLQKAREQTNWKQRAASYREWVGSTEKQ